tara:strand:+ start:154 stop:699 length:546 start_codon:yes stop_codon:yes gene_type:complete
VRTINQHAKEAPQEQYKILFKQMQDLCTAQGWGDPFSYARSKEILAAIELGHTIAPTLSGADAYAPSGKELEYKSTTGARCKGSYTGISVQDTIEEQERYLREEKLGCYHHYYNRFKDGKLVESWSMDGAKVCELLIPKLLRKYDTVLTKKDPRLSADITNKEIKRYGTRVNKTVWNRVLL